MGKTRMRKRKTVLEFTGGTAAVDYEGVLSQES